MNDIVCSSKLNTLHNPDECKIWGEKCEKNCKSCTTQTANNAQCMQSIKHYIKHSVEEERVSIC